MAISQAVAAGALAACSGNGARTEAEDPPASDMATLAILVFDLFPHESLAPTIYVDAAEAILARQNPVITVGLRDLRGRAGSERDWVELSEAERVRHLSAIQDGQFFTTLRTLSLEQLYRREAVWEMLGYGGSAIEQGGYIDRGFNDIDWLPQEGALQ